MIERADATGIGLALAGHGALLAALIYLIDRTPDARPSQPAIEVSFVDETGLISGGETTAPAAASVAPDLGAPEDAAPAPDPALQPRPAEPQAAPSPSAAPSRPQPSVTPQQRAAPVRTQPQQRSGTGGAPTQRGSRLGADFLKGLGDDPARRSDRPAGAVVTDQVRAGIDSAIAAALRPCRSQALNIPPEARVLRVRMIVTVSSDGRSFSNSRPEFTPNDRFTQYRDVVLRAAQRVLSECPLTALAARYPEYYSVPRGWRRFRYTFPE